MSKHNIPRIYINSEINIASAILLEKNHAHYLKNVMRRDVGDKVILFNGRSGEFLAEIISADKKSVMVNPTTQTRPQDAVPEVTLCFAPVKNAKNEFIIEKATELGVKAIQPVLTKKTIVDKINLEKATLTAIEASEQCERLTIPEIFAIERLEKILNNPKYADYKILHCDETGGGKPIIDALSVQEKGGKWLILIGPEGGFDKSEIELIAKNKNAVPVSLGPRILRADTACISAVTAWMAVLGDWQKSPSFSA
jgi:16S rRNA (uracil1498-N3)-methyltransferase